MAGIIIICVLSLFMMCLGSFVSVMLFTDERYETFSRRQKTLFYAVVFSSIAFEIISIGCLNVLLQTPFGL